MGVRKIFKVRRGARNFYFRLCRLDCLQVIKLHVLNFKLLTLIEAYERGDRQQSIAIRSLFFTSSRTEF